MVSSSLSFLPILAAASVLATPGQPATSGSPGQFRLVGDSLVSAQQAFVGTASKVYVVDKVEGNPHTINGHPAWASEYDVSSNTARPMDIVTNSFCAGGNVLGNGTWVNVGGNQAVTTGGATAKVQDGSTGPYFNPDGGNSIRFLDPCDDQSCNWVVNSEAMTSRRWYPTIETLEDGSIIIIGGDMFGGFLNSAAQSNPTFEYLPSKVEGGPITMPLLERTLPANLFPLTWLLPSGKLLVQANWATSLFDYKDNNFSGNEIPLPDIPDAVKTYPASAATVMLPLTPQNNYTAKILFCGGQDLQPNEWSTDRDLAQLPASDSCVSITPDVSDKWEKDDKLPSGRTMGNFILLPTGKIFLVNGANTGMAGYGYDSWAIGHSYADHPILQPVLYDPDAPAGSKFSTDGLSPSNIPRMYHSAALLLPDGTSNIFCSVWVSGSNPNQDYYVGPNITYPTEYRVELFYPSYYNERRPEPQGIPTSLSYGGGYFNISLSSQDLFGDVANLKGASVAIIRHGFSTHAMTMGQRYVQLETSYTGTEDGSGVLHVSQLPPNPAILAPGPAFLYVIVKGVPSIGVQVMCGSGKIEQQQTLAAAQLPSSNIPTSAIGSNNQSNNKSNRNSASALYPGSWTTPFLLVLSVVLQGW